MRKLYYTIKEVSQIIDEESYILRYWEKEFSQLKPAKNKSGNRIYSGKDIALLCVIKKLLRDEKKSVKEAKDIIDETLQKDENWNNATFEPDLFTVHSKDPNDRQQIVDDSAYLDTEVEIIPFLRNILELVKHL